MSVERLAKDEVIDYAERAVISDELIVKILTLSTNPLDHFINMELAKPGCILSKMETIITFIINNSFYKHRIDILSGLPKFGNAFGDIIRENSHSLYLSADKFNDIPLLNFIRMNHPI